MGKIRGLYEKTVDVCADWVVTWLRSRGAFVQVFLITFLWIPAFVMTGIDPKGTIYLDIATALSLITQVPLAMIGWQAMKKAEAAETQTFHVLERMLTTMNAVHELITVVKESLDVQEDLLEDIHDEVHDDGDEKH